jgi:diguanylate cyclase (GGDEF)-like protein
MFFNKPFCPQTNLIQDIADHNYIDKLTNLLNRDRFFKDLPDAKGIILIDLDDFFLINSVYSKEIGDEFLKKLAHKIAHNNCTKNSIYRTGGDEFAIISYQEKDLVGIAECLLETIERFYIKKDNILIQLSATIAISYKQPLIETADLALKYGKKNRLNLVVFSNTLNIFQETQAFLDITMRIKQALKTDNVVPFFQCIKDKDGNITKYESLMRIKEQDKYLVPAIFLDIAKKTKLYPQLTMHMVTKTFKFMRYKNIPFSINISYDDIINHRIYNFLLQEIDQFDKPQNIIIELLETEAFEQFNYVHNFINELKKRGVKIAIDDFGSGYSNFIYLEKLKPDFIKIDGEIVSKLLFSENSAFLVKTIVDFCKKNNIISIAEFVSHREIFLALKEIGVDEYQGYYLCKVEEDI